MLSIRPDSDPWSKSSPEFNAFPEFDPSSGSGTFFPSPGSGCDADSEFVLVEIVDVVLVQALAAGLL